MEHVNCSAVVPVGPLDTQLQNRSASVAFRTEIFNSMSFDVYVIDRDNIKYRIPRSSSAAKGKLAFRRGYGLTPGARHDVRNIVTTDDVTNSRVLSYLLEKWAKNPSTSTAQNMHSLDQYEFLVEEDFLRARRVVYLRDVDYVVCIDPGRHNHPYSHQGQLQRRHEEVREGISDAAIVTRRFFTWNVFIIDNAGKIGKRWINMFGHVHLIETCLDPNSQDGFYVVRNKHLTDAVSKPERISDFKETEDELDFPVYKTYQEALAANDSETMVKLRLTIEDRRIRELELETRSSRALADADKLRDDVAQQIRKNEEAERQHDREMRAIRETMAQERARAELDREKFEREREQFGHDTIMQGQKNAGESIKVIGAVITGVLGLLAIAIKWLK